MEQLDILYSKVDKTEKATSPPNDLYSVVDKSKKKSNPGNDLNSIVVKSDAATEAMGDLYSVVNKSKKKMNTQNDVYSVVDKSKKRKANDLSSNINTMEKITDSPSELYSVVDKSKKRYSSDHELHEIGGNFKNTIPGEHYSHSVPSYANIGETKLECFDQSYHSSPNNYVEEKPTNELYNKKTIFPKQKKVMILVALFITTALVLFIAVVVSASVILSKSQDSVTKNMNTSTSSDPTGTSIDSSHNPSCAEGHNSNEEINIKCKPLFTCRDSVHNWRKVADVNISVNESCPEPWTFNSTGRGCSSDLCNISVLFTVTGGEYSQVCGRVMGNATGRPNAFRPRTGIESHKLEYDGLGLRVSNSREHIWAYAVGSSRPTSNCPCNGANGTKPLPKVGNNYYCDDSENNTLWDQNYCGVYNNFTSSTWFHAKVIHTTNDIEAIICTNQPKANENFFVKVLQLYVK